MVICFGYQSAKIVLSFGSIDESAIFMKKKKDDTFVQNKWSNMTYEINYLTIQVTRFFKKNFEKA